TRPGSGSSRKKQRPDGLAVWLKRCRRFGYVADAERTEPLSSRRGWGQRSAAPRSAWVPRPEPTGPEAVAPDGAALHRVCPGRSGAHPCAYSLPRPSMAAAGTHPAQRVFVHVQFASLFDVAAGNPAEEEGSLLADASQRCDRKNPVPDSSRRERGTRVHFASRATHLGRSLGASGWV